MAVVIAQVVKVRLHLVHFQSNEIVVEVCYLQNTECQVLDLLPRTWLDHLRPVDILFVYLQMNIREFMLPNNHL